MTVDPTISAGAAIPAKFADAITPGKNPADTRVVVAMSGGVDSSVVAALLKEQGYDVVGITLQLYDHGAAIAKKGACCAGQDIHDARRVAQALDIPHYVLDYQSRFQESVIDDFVDGYLAGETPIPCIRCNQTVKFSDLLATARNLGADAMATGHYVRRVTASSGDASVELHRGADLDRDQSYFLFSTSREQLDFLRFPLGDLDKTGTRTLAARYNLRVAAKPDSQDICFVPEGRYASVIEKLRPGAIDPGDIVDQAGNVLGRHDGIINFTIGQRKGLGLGNEVSGPITGGEPLYVVRIDADTRRVVVGPREALLTRYVFLKEVNWLGDDKISTGQPVSMSVKLRSVRAPVAAMVTLQPEGRAIVELAEPEAGIATGQACVFYDGERVLGGGWIAGADRVVDNSPDVAATA